jgi:shikimate dehydrogenase
LKGNAVTFLAPEGRAAAAPGQPTVEQALRVYALPACSSGIELYGVLGNPVHRSRSPYLHNHAFRKCGKRALYLWLESPDPGAVLAWVREGRLAGVSVTTPFKEGVLEGLDEVEEPARALGAVNTVWRVEGRLRGANTDREAAEEMLAAVRGKPAVAVLGGGGSARAVLAATRGLGLAATVFNRDAERGETAARAFGAEWGGAWDGLDPGRYGVVINCTPVREPADLSPSLVRAKWAGTRILDLTYGVGPSGWEGLARRAGVPYRGGLEFLVRQAAGQLYRWTGRRFGREELAGGLLP